MTEQDEDLKARLRELERWRNQTGARLAKVEIMEELVRAMGPLPIEISTVRGLAEHALEKAKDAEAEAKEAKNAIADNQSVTRSNRWNLLTAAFSAAALLLTLTGLIFVILTFAGAGGAGP